MRMTGEQRVNVPRAKVWAALNDPDVLRQCIPGCQSLERDGDDRFVALAEVKVGPIGARFKGSVQLSDIDAPNGYTITGQGNGGIAGSAKGGAKVRLSDDGAGTLVSYEVDAEVGGRMAQLGGPIIDATAKQMAGKFFAKFGEVVGGGAAPAAGRASSAASSRAVARGSGGFPLAWLAALAVAVVAGYLLGQSGVAPAWVLGVVALALVSAVAGYRSGRGGPA